MGKEETFWQPGTAEVFEVQHSKTLSIVPTNSMRRRRARSDPEDPDTDHSSPYGQRITVTSHLPILNRRSTVDYIGAVQGIPVCFDAKECCVDTFPLSNIHSHQVSFMEAFEQQGGIAFFLIFFSHADRFYYLPFRDLMAILEAHGGWRTQKFPQRRTERRVLSAEAERISGAISGRNPAGSQNAGIDKHGNIHYNR